MKLISKFLGRLSEIRSVLFRTSIFAYICTLRTRCTYSDTLYILYLAVHFRTLRFLYPCTCVQNVFFAKIFDNWKSGKTCVLTGHVGSGKTSILSALTNQMSLESGSVFIDRNVTIALQVFFLSG